MRDILEPIIKRGWFVFPCRNSGPDKKPLTPHGYKDAVNTIEEAVSLFAPHLNAMIGVATGAVSGFFVVDVDVKEGKTGDDSLAELEQIHGELPHTVEAISCTGGRHLYFKMPGFSIPSRGAFVKDVDIRGDGGYIIIPPSSFNGLPYEWEASHHPDETPIAESPQWLIDLIINKKKQVDLTDVNQKISVNRNSTLTSLAGSLRRAGLSYEAIESHLIKVNDERCSPPLSLYDVQTIAKSVSRYEPEKISLAGPYTDVWNADIFVEQNGENIRYCGPLGGWFIWDGKRWVSDEEFRILRLAKDTIKKIRTMSQDKRLLKHAAASESESRLKAMVSLARSEGVTVKSEDFDKDQYLLNCQNGVLDLNTGQLKPHSRDLLLSKMVSVPYIPEEKCPLWKIFLNQIFQDDQDLIKFMQKSIGYSLSGSTEEQVIFILHGVGGNGKSTLLTNIYKLFGSYALNTVSSSLMDKHGESIPNDIARLKGMRLVTARETEKNKSLAESQIKQLTGDDPITARYLHKEYFDFFATFKIFLATNYKPNISGTDRGIWRRIVTIPFDYIVPEEEKDGRLSEKLQNEFPGILAWAVEGYKIWRSEGLGRPKRVLEANKEYEISSDVIGTFLTERCISEVNVEEQETLLLKSLQFWCKDGGLRPTKRQELLDYLKKNGYERTRNIQGKVIWKGLTLRAESQEEDPWNENL